MCESWCIDDTLITTISSTATQLSPSLSLLFLSFPLSLSLFPLSLSLFPSPSLSQQRGHCINPVNSLGATNSIKHLRGKSPLSSTLSQPAADPSQLQPTAWYSGSRCVSACRAGRSAESAFSVSTSRSEKWRRQTREIHRESKIQQPPW